MGSCHNLTKMDDVHKKCMHVYQFGSMHMYTCLLYNQIAIVSRGLSNTWKLENSQFHCSGMVIWV